MTRPFRHIKQCVVCGGQFYARRSDAKTCSVNCRSRLKVWVRNNAKDTKAAIRTVFILRCAIESGKDRNAASHLSAIKVALDQEIQRLKQKGLYQPTLDLEAEVKMKECSPTDAEMDRLRRTQQKSVSL